MQGVKGVNSAVVSPQVQAQRREKKEEVATGVGAAAGITASATRAAGKRGLQASRSLEAQFNQVVETVQTASRNVSRNTEEVTGLFSKFKSNIAKYSKQIETYLQSFKDTKFIGAIVNSPVTKAATKLFGGALAFFVLVTGMTKAFRTGAIAFDDFKSQYSEMFGGK